VLTDKGRVLVEHVNMIKKHQRPTQKLRQGGIIEREGALALSNVLVVCSRCDKPSRTGMKILGDGRKVRTCKRCGEAVDKG
jgi:large subunit ribosomal protein L24